MNVLAPWEVDPALSSDRLQVIADIITRVRREVAESSEAELGDRFFGQWSDGCRAYERQCFQLHRAAASGEHPWLEVLDSGMQFTFAVDGVPLRIYRGIAEKPPTRTRRVNLLEMIKQGELFEMGRISRPDLEWNWRIAVETDPEGLAFAITIVQVARGNTVMVKNPFPLPLAPSIAPLTTYIPSALEGVELAPAVVHALEIGADSSGSQSATILRAAAVGGLFVLDDELDH